MADDGKRTLHIDIVSDVVCPWCYVGKRNMEAALEKSPDLDVTIHWRPFQLDPTIPPEGLDRQTYMARKFGDRVPEIQARITLAAQQSGLALAFDKIGRSPNTLAAHRLIRWAWSAGVQDAIVERLFRAFFVDGEDIGDRGVLLRHAEAVGMDEAVVAKLFVDDADMEAVEADIAQARSTGVSGVPFFILNGQIGLSGAQPPDVFERAIAAALEKSPKGATSPGA